MTKETAIRLSISVALGTVLGIVAELVGRDDAMAIGLLTAVLSQLFIFLLDQQRMRSDYHEVKQLLMGMVETYEQVNRAVLNVVQMLPRGDQFSGFMSQQMLSSVQQQAIESFEEGLVVTDPAEVPKFWTSCLMNIESSLRVASFIDPGKWWTKHISEASLDVQLHQAATMRKAIHRTFIWEMEEELEALREAASRQEAGGIGVKHVSLEQVQRSPVLSELIERTGTPDLALVDNRWAVLHYLTPDRYSSSLKVTKNARIVTDVRAYLDHLEPEARPFAPAPQAAAS